MASGMASGISDRVNLSNLGHQFELVNYFTILRNPCMRVVDVTVSGFRLLTDSETEDVIEELQKQPEKERGNLARSYAQFTKDCFTPLFFDSGEQRDLKCYGNRFVTNPNTILCKQPVEMRDIAERFRFKLLCFKSAGRTHKILCNGGSPLTFKETIDLFKQTVAHIKTGRKSQEGPNEMSRTYATVSEQIYIRIALQVLADFTNYSWQEVLFIDTNNTYTVTVSLD